MINDELFNRVGIFSITHAAIESNPKAVQEALSKVIVTRAESMFNKGVIEYMGISDRFDIVEETEKIPEYEIIVEDNKNIKFIRLIK